MLSEYWAARLPLFYVFLSGIGFSFQTLIIKVLSEHGFHGSFQCIFFRGFVQLLLASYFVYNDKERLTTGQPRLFGNTNYVRFMLFMRSFVGFGGIAFSFLAVELIPMGDATVLIMLSPLITSILSYIMLGEPWRLPELVATIVSLVGVVLVAKPPLIFGGNAEESSSFFLGVGYGLVSAVSAAFAYLFVRILGTTAKMPWSNVCFSQAIGQIVLSIPCLYIFGQQIELNIPLWQFGMLLLGGTIGAVSQILMTMGMQREKSAAATGMRMSDVAFGYLWQVLFTSDSLSLLSLGGATLVTCSIFIILYYKDNSATSAGTKLTDSTGEEGKEIELTGIRSGLHSTLSLEELYELEEGFADSDAENANPMHAKRGVRGREMTNSPTGVGSAQFDYAALKASLERSEDLDADWMESEEGEAVDLPRSSNGGSGSAPDLDLSLHGEHGGLLNASVRLHAENGAGKGILGKLPLFGAADSGGL